MINTRIRSEKYERQRARRLTSHSRKRRRMTRSNLGIRLKGPATRSPADFMRWLLGRKSRKRTANKIPVALRPWVPHNRKMIARGNMGSLAAYRDQLQAICTPSQWRTMQRYFSAVPA